MHASSMWAATVGCFATIFLLALSVGDVTASECLVTSEVVFTSQVAVQVFFRHGLDPVEGATVSLVWAHGKGNPAATGTTDSLGHLQVLGVPPGLYRVRVALTGRPPVGRSPVWAEAVNVRVVPSTDSPATLIAVGLSGMDCSTYCTVAGTIGPLAKAPSCLAQKRKW
jgi:hypothetical protein